MTTPAQAQEAPVIAQRQRFAALKLLRVDETKASADDLVLVEKVRAAKTPAEWDKALASKKVNELFCRGVLLFGGAQ